MPRTLTLAAFAALCTLTLTCKKEPPVVPEPTLSLTAVDASCIEAWLKVTTTQVPATVRLLRDGQRVADRRLITPDSLVVDEGLLPKRAYTYVLQRLAADSSVLETSTGVQVTTMDTTSHNFTWETTLLGDGSSSALYDVAIINDTLAYAVGEIYLRDSTGQIDPQAWNAAKWNGQRWELKRIPFMGPCSAVLYPPLKAIWAFSSTNILVTNGGSIVDYDGTNATMDCRMNSLLAGAINKIWASSAQDIYIVGNAGTIVHYNGSAWRRLESGTGLDVYDVYGERKGATERPEILAVASKVFVNFERGILRLAGTNATILSDSGINWPLSGVWFAPDRSYFVVGSGIYQKKSLDELQWRNGPLDITTYYTNAVRGTSLNNVVVVGAHGELLHFNGASWKSFRPQTGLLNGQYYSVAARGNLVVAVGYEYPRAVVLRGTKN